MEGPAVPSVAMTRDLRFLESENRGPYHLLLLNQPLASFLPSFIKAAKSIVCADGGSNRYFDAFIKPRMDEGKSCRMPSAIVGDLDSIRNDVKEFFSIHGVEVIKNSSPATNDLYKAWEVLRLKIEKGDKILIFGAIGGRFDQTVANLHFLHTVFNETNDVDLEVYVLDQDNVCFLLLPGTTSVTAPLTFVTKVCGILPLLECRSITTKGFRWDVTNAVFVMGKFISSSNELAEPQVSVSITDPVLWSSEIDPTAQEKFSNE